MNYLESLNQLVKYKKQDDLARDLGVTLATVNRWINNKVVPRDDAKNRINDLLKSLDFNKSKNIEEVEYFVKDISKLEEIILSEDKLELLADIVKSKYDKNKFVNDIVESLPEFGRNFDWNVGSILQHFDSELIIDSLKRIGNMPKFYNSIGLSWLLGEINRKDDFILDFLKDVVRYSNNFEVIWRAAFSIENLKEEEAIVLLKRSIKIDENKDVNYYLDNIKDKRSIIAILLKSNTENIQTIIYPRIKEIFLNTKNITEVINCCWLIGRLNIIDSDILNKIIKNFNTSNYELKYYTYFALQHNTNETLRTLFEKSLEDKDSLIRKMACRAIRKLGSEKSLSVLETSLLKEQDPKVVSEISRAIYCIKDPKSKSDTMLLLESNTNENGMISDETDKWYKDASIYNVFSESEDPQNICFDLVLNYLTLNNFKVRNPIDLATGTGRYLTQIRDKISYEGTLYGVDYSIDMCNFLDKKIKREKMYVSKIKIINSSIKDISEKIKEKSNFIVSSFGFPSKISDTANTIKELKSVYEMLAEDGIFVTVGWDETFNDELNYMWYKYIPDFIQARDFEDWRRKKILSIKTTRNCNLNWFKKGIIAPLQFHSLSESVKVMGYLFGRDAAKSIIRNNQTEWDMSMGITLDTKESLKNKIEFYERN